MGKTVKKYQIQEFYIRDLLSEVNSMEVLPDINQFVQQIFYSQNNSPEIDDLCIQYFKRYKHGFQYLQLRIDGYEVSDELAKKIFAICLELDLKASASFFDHLCFDKPDLQVVLYPLIIDQQIKMFQNTIRIRFHENKTNRLLNDYRQKLIEALVSEAI